MPRRIETRNATGIGSLQRGWSPFDVLRRIAIGLSWRAAPTNRAPASTSKTAGKSTPKRPPETVTSCAPTKSAAIPARRKKVARNHTAATDGRRLFMTLLLMLGARPSVKDPTALAEIQAWPPLATRPLIV